MMLSLLLVCTNLRKCIMLTNLTSLSSQQGILELVASHHWKEVRHDLSYIKTKHQNQNLHVTGLKQMNKETA